MQKIDNIARIYRENMRKPMGERLTPLARAVYSLMRHNGSVTALDAMRSPLGISSGSLTRRITELRRAGFPIVREFGIDHITQRRYAKWRFVTEKTPETSKKG